MGGGANRGRKRIYKNQNETMEIKFLYSYIIFLLFDKFNGKHYRVFEAGIGFTALDWSSLFTKIPQFDPP